MKSPACTRRNIPLYYTSRVREITHFGIANKKTMIEEWKKRENKDESKWRGKMRRKKEREEKGKRNEGRKERS